jgi:hypothetical protein
MQLEFVWATFEDTGFVPLYSTATPHWDFSQFEIAPYIKDIQIFGRDPQILL